MSQSKRGAKFAPAEQQIIRDAITAATSTNTFKQATLARTLFSAGKLPGRTYLSIYSQVRQLTPIDINATAPKPSVASPYAGTPTVARNGTGSFDRTVTRR